MSDDTEKRHDNAGILTLTAQIVSAYAGKAKLNPTELTAVIGSVSRALMKLGSDNIEQKPTVVEPAVPIKKSVTADFIICLEDGKRLKMLTRHLMSAYGMTPAAYRAKWSLPRDYPMVAPNYAATRSQLAKKIGLGRSRTIESVEMAKAAPARRGRPKKVV